jgi:hypothetical protein
MYSKTGLGALIPQGGALLCSRSSYNEWRTPQEGMPLRPRQNNSQRYALETQQEVEHDVQISRLRLPRLHPEEIRGHTTYPKLIDGYSSKVYTPFDPAACNRQHDSRGTLHLVRGPNNFRSRPTGLSDCNVLGQTVVDISLAHFANNHGVAIQYV